MAARIERIDLNSDLGEGFGPWTMGDDKAMLDIVTSANIAAGGHASDPETMFATLATAAGRGVVVGAHPGYPDREGFGRRVIPMAPAEIGRMVAAGKLGSMILWGPPGTGKTTIARLLAGAVSLHYVQLSAVFSGVADLRRTFADARAQARAQSVADGKWPLKGGPDFLTPDMTSQIAMPLAFSPLK